MLPKPNSTIIENGRVPSAPKPCAMPPTPQLDTLEAPERSPSEPLELLAGAGTTPPPAS